jgi:hypothetical protein
MQYRNKNMKPGKILLGLSLMMALALSAQAGKTGGGGTPPPPPPPSGVFVFSYNVGTVGNYHVYAYACQVSAVSSRPSGTVRLGNWWVKDLGPVTGSGTVGCPAPLTVKGQVNSVLGVLFFANASDVGGQAFLHPVVDVQIYTAKYYSGDASIEVITPNDGDADDVGIQLYLGAPFTPFSWDISAYVWDVEPSTW